MGIQRLALERRRRRNSFRRLGVGVAYRRVETLVSLISAAEHSNVVCGRTRQHPRRAAQTPRNCNANNVHESGVCAAPTKRTAP